ncbi:MAG TPA: transglutaminase domain-containing protein, partial [bacterium (Candidatus Stahlbacteria)]|nr:transglutaminase domain-containing protein [Candidatus Stahlbacteria bacterium]
MTLIILFTLLIPKINQPTSIMGWPGQRIPVRSDTSQTPEVIFTERIKDLADSLDHDPRKIYEWVKNNIVYIPYYSSIKGSKATIIDSIGNDIDQASLLLALLRYSKVPSRYVIGRVRMDIEQVLSLLGERDKRNAVEILKKIKTRPIFNADTTWVEFNHCYVRARVPMQYYRGSQSDRRGTVWLPLFPSLKEHKIGKGPDIPAEMNFDPEEFFGAYLKKDSITDLFTIYKEDIIGYLNAHYPDLTYDDVLYKKEIVSEHYPILPFTSPYHDSGTEYKVLPDTFRNYLTIRIERPGAEIITKTLLISDLIDYSLFLDYIPATHEDSLLVERYGGIWNVPPYLLSVKPAILLHDSMIAIGKKVSMLEEVDLYLDLYLCDGSRCYPLTTKAGIPFGIGIGGLYPEIPSNHYSQLALEASSDRLIREIDWTMHCHSISRPSPRIAFPILSIRYSGGVPTAIDLLGDGISSW